MTILNIACGVFIGTLLSTYVSGVIKRVMILHEWKRTGEFRGDNP